MYGFLGRRGPSWDQGCFGNQDGGPGSLGLVLPPDEKDIQLWLEEDQIHCMRGQQNPIPDTPVGWWIDKTAVVKWLSSNIDESERVMYLRAGDGGAYDLVKSDEHAGPSTAQQLE